MAVALVWCGLCVSCAAVRNPFRSAGPPAPEVLMPGASREQIIAAVNQNAARVRNYQTDNASITVPGMLGVPMLSGKIRAMRPGRLHLQASTNLTGPEVDLGANDELFWFWVRRNEPPALYFARHDQFTGSAAQHVLPIEPQWLLDALGFAEFKPTDIHEPPIVRGNDIVEIRSVVNSPGGKLTRLTKVDARRAWILEQHIYAPDGRILATAVARSHRFYPEVGASLPQKIDVSMPAAELSLTIDVGDVRLNTLVDNPQLWALPAMPGYPLVNLAGAPPGTASTLGGQLGRADWYGPSPAAGVADIASMSPPSQPAAPIVAHSPSWSAGLPSTGAPQPVGSAPGRLPPQTSIATPTAAVQAEASGPAYPSAAQRLPAGGRIADSVR